MGLGDHSRSVTMHCSTCGGRDFEFDQEVEDGPVRCVTCDRTYSRGELIRENGRHIEEHVEDMKAEIMADVKSSLRDAFKGFKHIKIK